MTQENSYSIKLKNPRWQKKRLKIFERDKWACRFCKSEEDMLVVHHLLYLPNTEPWDYEDKYLITLCENCHEYETSNMQIAKETLSQSLRRRFFSHGLLVAGLLISANFDYYDHNPTINGKYKGYVHIDKNKSISKDDYIIRHLKSNSLSDEDINTICSSTSPNLIKLLYAPKLEVADGKTN